jgi:hypothetical protein
MSLFLPFQPVYTKHSSKTYLNNDYDPCVPCDDDFDLNIPVW